MTEELHRFKANNAHVWNLLGDDASFSHMCWGFKNEGRVLDKIWANYLCRNLNHPLTSVSRYGGLSDEVTEERIASLEPHHMLLIWMSIFPGRVPISWISTTSRWLQFLTAWEMRGPLTPKRGPTVMWSIQQFLSSTIDHLGSFLWWYVESGLPELSSEFCKIKKFVDA